MTGLLQDNTKQGEVANLSVLAQFIAQRKVDMGFLQNIFEQWVKEPSKVQAPILELLIYYCYVNEDYNRLFYLLNKTKSLEYMAIKVSAQLKINRVDLAEQTYKHMKAIDEDNVLTTLAHCWLTVSSYMEYMLSYNEYLF